MIVLDRLTRTFGPLTAVDGISLNVGKGEVLGFLGPNGAGETTTMRMIAGFLEPSAGRVEVCGFDLATSPIEAKRRLGYLPEGAPLYGDMTARHFLDFVADVRGFGAAERRQHIDRVVAMVTLEDVLDRPIETLSKGFKRRVGLAQALIHDPPVLVLDEPTDGLDPNQKHQVRALIRGMAHDKAIVISTHILEEVEAVCSRAVIIADGKLVADGTAEALLRRLPEHDSVVAVIAAADVKAARAALSDIASSRTLHESDVVDGRVTLRLLAAGSGPAPLAEVAHRLQAAGVPVEALRGERGRLDDVFRMLTTGAVSIMLREVRAVARRELAGYFSTPVAYVFIVIFLAMASALTFYVGGFFERQQASLETFFSFHPWLYRFLIPAVAMRLWAEERKSGTIELLMTMPMSTTAAVLGKFVAAWLFVAVALALTFPLWITVNILGQPDNGVILAGYLGSLLMAGAFLAIGSCLSAITRNQVVAFILAATVSFLLCMAGLELVQDGVRALFPAGVADTIAGFSFLSRFGGISKGVIDGRDIVFFVSMIAFWLFATVVVVDAERAA
ncbi:MAG: ATP-binding cassette domain-containing protein [Rhodospirillales bacterium]|nr:ATP-binding cassette domain-containing protein [Rhodospirillales bacterium]